MKWEVRSEVLREASWLRFSSVLRKGSKSTQILSAWLHMNNAYITVYDTAYIEPDFVILTPVDSSSKH
jgi:hypothetical protein